MIDVVCGVIRQGEKIFLARRSENMPHPGSWEFPGGKVKPGEKRTEAIKRELFEELGIDVSVIKVLETVKWQYPEKKIGLVPIICEIRSGEIHPQEHDNTGWFSLEEMKEIHMLEADREIVKQLEEQI